MKIIFLGTPDYVNLIVQTLDKNFDLIKTIRNPDDLNNETIEQFNNLQPDLLVVASFGKIIPNEVLQIPKFGAINIHPSLLPKYRGPSPIQNQILDGVKDSGISFILMDSKMDHGPLLKQVDFQISPEDTFQSLCEKMFSESAKFLPRVINDFINGKIKPRLQDHAIAEYCNPLNKEDGYFAIDNPPNPEKLNKMVRAYYPWPRAWTKWNGKIVKFLPNPTFIAKRDREGRHLQETRSVTARPQSGEAISGRSGIAASQEKAAPRNDASFLIQMEGKKATDLKSFLNGYPDFPIKQL